jgi:8-oxo-dGTP diphosphatase
MTEHHRFPVDVLVLLVRDGRILLTERAGTVYLAGHWAVPGGKVDAGESVVAAAAREVAEEVDLAIDPDRFQFVGVTHHCPPHGDARVGFGFVVTDFAGEPSNVESDKCSRIAWFPPDELPDPTMAYTAEIVRLFLDKEPFSLHDW